MQALHCYIRKSQPLRSSVQLRRRVQSLLQSTDPIGQLRQSSMVIFHWKTCSVLSLCLDNLSCHQRRSALPSRQAGLSGILFSPDIGNGKGLGESQGGSQPWYPAIGPIPSGWLPPVEPFFLQTMQFGLWECYCHLESVQDETPASAWG